MPEYVKDILPHIHIENTENGPLSATINGIRIWIVQFPKEKENPELESLLALKISDFIQIFTMLRIELCCFQHEKRGTGGYQKCPRREHNLCCGHLTPVIAKFIIALEICLYFKKITNEQKYIFIAELQRICAKHVIYDNQAYAGYERELLWQTKTWRTARKSRENQEKLAPSMLNIKDRVQLLLSDIQILCN